MKKPFQHFRERFSRRNKIEPDWPEVDIGTQIEAIKHAEADESIGLGRRIHSFSYHEFELRLDRDITGTYRVIANMGNERRYSFAVKCPHKDYKVLRAAFEEITEYLNSDRRIADLPDNERLKGYFFGS